MNDTIECVEIHNAVDKCRFYLETESCKTNGVLDYMYFIYCDFPSQFSWAGITLCILFLLMLFIGLGVTADDFLCPSLVVITKTLRLSQNIAGVTFLAFGNGAPDIFSSMAGTEQSRPELVIGTLFGAGIFVTSVVAGSIMITKPFKIMERPFLRDIIFYVCAAFGAFLRFYYGNVTIWHSVGFIMLYIVYIFVVVISRIIYSKIKAKAPPPVPEIEIQSSVESSEKQSSMSTRKSVSFQLTGEEKEEVEDNPEAAGVVLRRFSFRGSISVNLGKKRHSSIHAHHEHAIKAITQSANFTEQEYYNPAYSNGHRPPPLETQISNISLASLLSSNGEQTTLREFVMQVCPIDIEAWSDKSWSSRIFDIIKAPVCALLIITVPVVDYENDKNNWCRPLSIIQCLTAPSFVILAIKKYNIYLWNTVPLWGIIALISLVIAIIVYCTSSNHCQPIYHSAFGFIGFIASVMWVYLLASEIVSLLQTIGTIFKLSDTILGLTVLAWGNSIGDFISNLSVARQGYPRMGISACYGGPLLNLLLGIGIPYTVSIIKTGNPIVLKYEKLMTLLYSTLTVILLSTIMTMTALRFNVKRYFGMILIGIYLIFLTTAIILETKVI